MKNNKTMIFLNNTFFVYKLQSTDLEGTPPPKVVTQLMQEL